MPTYEAILCADAEFAVEEIQAATPEKALKKALKLRKDDFLDWRSYEGKRPVSYITIRDEKGQDLAEWQSSSLRLEKAAPDLLKALKALSTRAQDLANKAFDGGTTGVPDAIERLNVSITDSLQVIAQAEGRRL